MLRVNRLSLIREKIYRSGSALSVMRRNATPLPPIALALLLLASQRSLAVETTGELDKASQLVQAAMDAELDGNPQLRAKRLYESLKVSPDYAPARWQSGQVVRDGAWVSVDEAAAMVAKDPAWQEYQQIRFNYGANVSDQEQLAKWCGRNGLAEEEKFHWRFVLALAPDHKVARGRLGVRPYRGGLFTDEEIESIEEQQELREEAYNRFEKTLSTLRREATTRDAYVQANALEELAAIDDPAAIDALCTILVVDRSDYKKLKQKLGPDGADELAEKLQLAAVTAIGRMPQHEATLALLRFTVFSDWSGVRAHAAKQLKSRRKTDYVPLLVSGLAAPIEANIRVYATPFGGVGLRQELFQAGAERNTRSTQSSLSVTAVAPRRRGNDDVMSRARAAAGHNQKVASNLRRANSQADAARMAVNQANARIATSNQRLQEALQATTGMSYGDDVEAYWDAWETYNDIYSEGEPEYAQYYSNVAYDYTPARSPLRRLSTPSPPTALGRLECFPAGTPVWTKSGAKPIERIVVGDQVLSQDPISGELAYRFVLDTTLRPPTPVFRLMVGNEEIIATRGHRFWVNGRGWRMVGFLKPDMPLHRVSGAAKLNAVEDVGEREVYNLVVDDFHTYFVGRHKLLVHDSHCPHPVVGPIPGMSLQAAADTPAAASP